VPNEAARHVRAPSVHAPLVFRHDPELPISARRVEILEALERHRVLIVAGETGSGKSTQLPQYCLEQGRGSKALIAHTQPRRLAARALAARIAEELSEPLGRTVGFRVRFADQVSDATRLVLMTDGLLLAELGGDPLLSRYDTVIVDEAHERSLNVDLLLGVLKRLLERRADLKVIITSATLAVERVSDFFGGAPVLRVSGRNHPIEVRYAAADDEDDPDLPAAVSAALEDIATTPGAIGSGDVLVFLPGEREIRDVAEVLEREHPQVEVLTLYSRLSWEQQSKIFKRGPRRRIVLATNVAETSITVPGIRAVIDSGLARISRYSPRNRLQRLPIEPVSRASADQRKGRCGRIGPGLCLRLYSQQNFEARPEYTEPEVLRTNLAALLLRLAADRLGDAESFPFIDAPDGRALADGYRLLQELKALDGERRVTSRGRAMARLPLDPRLSCALLESRRYHAESELLAIVSGMSVPDPRIAASEDAPSEPAAQETAKSDFNALLRLWRAYRKAREHSRRELRRWCKERHLSLLRLSEWEDVHAQVADRASSLGFAGQRKAASYTAIHRALLAGFCTMVGARAEEGEYHGPRGLHFHVFPGSALRRRRPRWVMAAQIVETSRVFGRMVAEVEPMWIEAAAAHLVRREFIEPDFDEARGEVVARERVTLLGLVLSANRIVNYGPIAPEESRRIFAREALVYGRLTQRPDWLLANDATVRSAEHLEDRLRVRDLLQPPEFFVDFYAERLPRQVSSAATLEHFTRHLTEAQRQSLMLTQERVLARSPDARSLEQFPERVRIDELELPIDYRFAPGEIADGATLRIPLLALPSLTRARVEAAVPGLLEPRIVALLRSLPKEARRELIPVGAAAQSFLASTPAASADLQALGAWLKEARGIPEALIKLDSGQVPAHLVPRLSVVEEGRELCAGSDLARLRRSAAAEARRRLDERARREYPRPWRRFESSELPRSRTLALEAGTIEVFPTLLRDGSAVVVRFEWSAAEAAWAWRDGAVRLAQLMLEPQMRELGRTLAANTHLLLAATPYLRREALFALLLDLALRRACFEDGEAPRLRADFEAAIDRGRSELHTALDAAAQAAQSWFTQAREVRRLVDDSRARSPEAAAETEAHLARIFDAAALGAMPDGWLAQIPRYLKAEERRWQRVRARGPEPVSLVHELTEWTHRQRGLEERIRAELRTLPELADFGLWIEEYRVSRYAQELKTLGPVSAHRLEERAAHIETWLAR